MPAREDAVGAEGGEGEDGGRFGVGGCEEGQGWVRDGLPGSFVEVGLEGGEGLYLCHFGIEHVSQGIETREVEVEVGEVGERFCGGDDGAVIR